MPRIRAAIVAYDSSAGMLADHALPTVLASCIDDHWPVQLRECIANATPDALVNQHACDKVVPRELAEQIAKRFGVASGQVQSMLGL